MDNQRILYSINVEDVQTVAMETLGRELSENEIKLVEDRIGDFFHNWFEILETLIKDVLD